MYRGQRDIRALSHQKTCADQRRENKTPAIDEVKFTASAQLRDDDDDFTFTFVNVSNTSDNTKNNVFVCSWCCALSKMYFVALSLKNTPTRNNSAGTAQKPSRAPKCNDILVISPSPTNFHLNPSGSCCVTMNISWDGLNKRIMNDIKGCDWFYSINLIWVSVAHIFSWIYFLLSSLYLFLAALNLTQRLSNIVYLILSYWIIFITVNSVRSLIKNHQ